MALVDRRYLYNRASYSILGIIDGAIARCFYGMPRTNCIILSEAPSQLRCTLNLAGYIGHYILITGYDERRKGYYIKDPARSAGIDFVSFDSIEKARLSRGTDEDLLVIPWEQAKPLRNPFACQAPASPAA